MSILAPTIPIFLKPARSQAQQRLNRQRTKPDGEELAYSMIKAYWPDLEKPINEVSEHRMPQARMFSLGVRAALATDAKQNLPGSPTVSALRLIARKEKDKKDLIQDFILQKHLQHACDLVDQWLKYDPKTNPRGLLPVPPIPKFPPGDRISFAKGFSCIIKIARLREFRP